MDGATSARAQQEGNLATMERGHDDIARIAADAYVFAYPLVLMDVTRQQVTAVPAPTGPLAPQGQFAHLTAFPDHTFTSVVSPNADTLYSSAWLDLHEEPMVLSLPDTGGRYYLMPMLDGWTNIFASPGARTTGTGAGAFAITGPYWTGQLPADVQEIRSPTELVWILGRTQTNGAADYPFVHTLQAQYRLVPLSAWGTAYVPPAVCPVDPEADREVAPVDQVARMSPRTFWTRFATLLRGNPPKAEDAPMVAQLAALGIVPGHELDWDGQAAEHVAALETGTADGLARVEALGKTPPFTVKNTWVMSYGLGSYGTDYDARASIAWVGLGANLTKDAMYPLTRVDRNGEPLHGSKRYVMHFAAGQLPPANAFWSITMYDERQFFVDNPIRRYAIGDRDHLRYGADGSLDILIQHESPGADRESNWLPAPPDSFNLVMRLYWPKDAMLDGTWVPPTVDPIG